MGRGRRKNASKIGAGAKVSAGEVIVEDNMGTEERVSKLEPGCAVVSLKRFPKVLKERIEILQARRKVAGVKDETLEMLHAEIAKIGVEKLEGELDALGWAAPELPMQDERETNP